MKILSKTVSLIVPAVLLSALSVVALLSFDANLARQQFIFIILGIFLYFVVFAFDLTILKSLWKPLYALGLFLLLMTILFGKEVNGATRWLEFGPVTFQPSELCKIILILCLAAMLSSKGWEVLKLKQVIIYGFAVMCYLVLLLVQPDFGTAMIYLLSSLFIVSQLKIPKIYFALFFIVIGLISYPVWNLLQDFQRERILVFINPSKDPLGSGYNVLQSEIAVGAGQVFGKGFGQGTQSKLKFLPEYHTDFVFASYAEEWGFVGVLVLLLLFALLLMGLLKQVSQSQSRFAHLVAVGVFGMIVSQVFINIGMNLAILPVTGITLPLMSYGGSSILVTYISLAIVSSVVRSDQG